MKTILILVVIAAVVAGVVAWRMYSPAPRAVENAKQGIQKGVFYLIDGANYQTQTLSGVTDSKGQFQYRTGETVTFSVGDLVLGSALGKQRMTTADLMLGASGDLGHLKWNRVTNLSRFVQSLDEDNNVDNGIQITARTRDLVSQYNDGSINIDLKAGPFGEQPNLVELLGKLKKTLVDPSTARNYVRWGILGVKLTRNVKVPLRDGSYVLADVFQPIQEGKYPPIVQMAAYGKTFIDRGCDCNAKDIQFHDDELDKYFEGNPDNVGSEVNETTDMAYWVPRGYVSIRLDAPGICNNPGVLAPYGVKETEALYDSIEWAAQQPWSNGNVAVFGTSYFGVNAVLAAGLNPPHLKAMIPGAGDSDRYNQVVYTNGILNATARQNWWDEVKKNRCMNQKTVEDTIGMTKTAYWLAHPFNEAPWYGNYAVKPPLEMDADGAKVNVPIISISPEEHTGAEHVKGGIELFLDVATPKADKQLRVVTGDFNNGYTYDPVYQEYFLDFFEHYLKGVQNGITSAPKVAVEVRTGQGGWYWLNSDDYPIPNTDYKKIYLDATPSSWAGDGNRKDFLKLSWTAPTAQASKSYSADVHFDKKACRASGISFVSEPLTEDMVMVGYPMIHFWAGSTSSDADIFTSLRVMDTNNREIPYALGPGRGVYPVGKGWGRLSHRALNTKRSTPWRPLWTNTKADYAPLKGPNDIVSADMEIEPTTAVLHKGTRIRVDIQPVIGCDWGSDQYWDASYHAGAQNAIYTGGDHTSYVQLPIVPAPK